VQYGAVTWCVWCGYMLCVGQLDGVCGAVTWCGYMGCVTTVRWCV